MHVFQTEGLPPSLGSVSLANIGCTMNSSPDPSSMVSAKSTIEAPRSPPCVGAAGDRAERAGSETIEDWLCTARDGCSCGRDLLLRVDPYGLPVGDRATILAGRLKVPGFRGAEQHRVAHVGVAEQSNGLHGAVR
jgi:hypothetical protein